MDRLFDCLSERRYEGIPCCEAGVSLLRIGPSGLAAARHFRSYSLRALLREKTLRFLLLLPSFVLQINADRRRCVEIPVGISPSSSS